MQPTEALLEAASRPYAAGSRFQWHFARGKLKRDPVYFALLRMGLIPDRARVLDLGCGQGILLALLAAAQTYCRPGERTTPDLSTLEKFPLKKSGEKSGRADAGDRPGTADGFPARLWPEGWAAPPTGLRLHGLELRADAVRAAQRALGGRARVERADLSSTALPRCDVAVLLDVLHYLPPDAQTALLRRAAAALAPGGMLLVREADARGGAAFALTRAAERLMAWARRRPQRFHFRPVGEWRTLLDDLGLDVRAEAMSHGTPFANALLIARKPPVG